VLWVSGEQQQARAILDAALQAHPDNEVLRGTVERLRP
jgi:hypothetical protein